jgi:hypothetical protein
MSLVIIARASDFGMKRDYSLPMECRQAFGSEGFSIVPGALTAEEAARLRVACVDALAGVEGTRVMVRNAGQVLPEVRDLIDNPLLLRRVVTELGAFIRVIASEAVVRRAGDPGLDWHRDGGPLMRHLAGLSHLKVQVFLSPVLDSENGNLILLPGSHCGPLPPRESVPDAPAEAVTVTARPGDAVLWDAALLHRVDPNEGTTDRVSVILAYGFLWMQPYDYVGIEPSLEREGTALQRLLFGERTEQTHPYYPADREHRIALLSERLGPVGTLPYSDLSPYARPGT